MIELHPTRFNNLRQFVPDPYDMVLSKLSRNIERDRQHVEDLARTERLDPAILRGHYAQEMRSILIGDFRLYDQTVESGLRPIFHVLKARWYSAEQWSPGDAGSFSQVARRKIVPLEGDR